MDLATVRSLTPRPFGLYPLTQAEFEYLINLTQAGQIYKGEPTPDVVHFILNSGMHSPCYLNLSILLSESNLCSIFAQQMIVTCELEPGDVDVVACSAMASIPLGCEVARQLNCRAVYVEKGKGRALETFRFRIEQGERVLVVNELMTTGGGTTFDTKRLIIEQNPHSVEFLPFAGVLVHRSKDDQLADGTPVRRVFHFGDFPTYDAGCPFCAAGSELITDVKKGWTRRAHHIAS
jgi:orotate phosphoribosyltransferase